MPVKKVPGGYRWGNKGKVYKRKKDAERQGRAIYAGGYKGKSNGKVGKRKVKNKSGKKSTTK